MRKTINIFENLLFAAGLTLCFFGLPLALAGGKIPSHLQSYKTEMRCPVEIMAHNAIAENKAIITCSDCEHAERVLVSYALELRQQGESDEDIQKALNEIAREY